MIIELKFYIYFITYSDYASNMSIKTLIFGHDQRIIKMVNILNPNTSLSNDNQSSVHVENLSIHEKNFLLFTINDRSLITQQCVGSNALIFFIDHQKPLYQEKQFLIDLLHAKKQFDAIPLIVLFDKEQGLSIKQVINYFELFKMKDRTSMIKQINFAQTETINDTFEWINNQVNFNRSQTSFDAHPKVIKMKPKYRQSEQDQSVKKYEDMLKDKQVRLKVVKDQETTYINQEKERIKNQNMEKQLANFNKNKKKMTPYDIKATPNPKIQANLHFFLKDPKSQKQPQANIKIQTDQFKPRPPEKPYVPKKTGINISTQIQQNQLFDFDKQVRPILNILTIKALQTAALQIQEQEEFARIQKYKAAYRDRVKKQKQHEQKKIQDELTLIKKKEKLLAEARKKHQQKKNIKKRIICYDISNRFLQNIYKKANLNVYNKNQYFDPYENQIRTGYLGHLMVNTSRQLKVLSDKQQAIMGVFDKDCVEPIVKLSQKPKLQRQALKKQYAKRRINQSANKRILHILYRHNEQIYSSFSKYIQKNFDGTLEDFIRTKEQQYQDISDKMSTGDLPEDELVKVKAKQNAEFSNNHQAFLIDSDKDISFSITPNRYEKSLTNDLMNLGFVLLDKEGQILDTCFFNKNTAQSDIDKYSFIKRIKDLRSSKNIVNMDQAILIDLKKINANAHSLILLTKFNNVSKYADEQANKCVKYASYGLEFYEKNIPIHKENISEKINWAEIIKPAEGDQEANQGNNKQSEGLINVAYILTRKGQDYWKIQHTRYVHNKPVSEQQLKEKIIQQLSKYYARSLQIFKEDDEEDQPPSSPTKKTTSRKEKRGRSKKNIQDEQKTKITFKVTSRILPEIEVDFSEGLQQITAKLSDCVKEWRQFVESCGEPGWELLLKGKPIESIEQLKKFKKVGDLQIVKLQPVIEEEQKQPQQGAEGQNEQDS